MRRLLYAVWNALADAGVFVGGLVEWWFEN
jgi:hypothetical protein